MSLLSAACFPSGGLAQCSFPGPAGPANRDGTRESAQLDYRESFKQQRGWAEAVVKAWGACFPPSRRGKARTGG
ncbi:hypothetical protein ZHAS_00021675 [Anopheles sinensis]|uniref:Uncharacterized protein n=1 Tax=Anopheles sinensis TaxID=74873 RepID=A0A084WT20_ANOSI|nr:hypothetical protein ZHAS_00021675 [Anopheles sinensis]